MAGKNSLFSCVKHREKGDRNSAGADGQGKAVAFPGAKSSIIPFTEGLRLQELPLSPNPGPTALITVTLVLAQM